MLATENRIQRRVRFCQVALLSPAELRPPGLLCKCWELGLGSLAGGGEGFWKCPGELSHHSSPGKTL